MYLYAVERFNINSITHKYLVRGHTQNEGDAVHSIIERSVKKSKKSGPIYVPDQYVCLIRNAKKKGNPLNVKEMSFGDFWDLKVLYDEMGINLSKNTDGKEFKINEVRILQFEKGSNVIRYKTSYKQLEWYCMEFRTKKTRSSNSQRSQNINPKPAYTEKIPLSEKKLEDFKSLMDHNQIPVFYSHFFNSLY